VHGCLSRHGRRLLALATLVVAGLAAAPAHAGLLATGLTTDNRIVTFDTAAPGTLLSSVPVVGLQPGESLLAIDDRPLTSVLYAVGSTNRAYLIDSNGQATQVGPVFATPLSGTAFGIDFNPAADRLRIVSNDEQNMRWNPITGTIAAVDTSLTPLGEVVAAAYTNNDQDAATATTLFGIDAATDSLVRIGGVDGVPSPNGGAVTSIGPLGVDTSERAGLDVPLDAATTAFASLTVAGVSQLYGVDLATGAATLVGAIGPSGTEIVDLAVSAQVAPQPQPAPQPPAADPPPGLSAVSLQRRTFAAAGVRRTTRKRVARGTTFRFTLSESAKVRIAFKRRTGGRRVGGKCLAPTRARRNRRACTRYVAVGSISASGIAGPNSVKFSGRLKGRPLAVGSYRATLTATDAAGQRSGPTTLRFSIVRP
jgi:Domain of unknown function (DUF4394)